MSLIEYNPMELGKKIGAEDARILQKAVEFRREAIEAYENEDFKKALEKTVDAMREMREFSDFTLAEFRELVVVELFDLSTIHFALKDYKQSKKELEHIYRFLEPLLRLDGNRFGKYHVMAMELSTQILRSRKRMMEMLAKQQIHTGILYEKVNAGVATATDKLVESLCKDAEMMASTGDYKGAVKFYMEAIKLSKKRAGRVTRREVAMTIEMARLMLKSKSSVERAVRLLNAVMPHAIALETVELEQEIVSLLQQAEKKEESVWKTMVSKMQAATKRVMKGNKNEEKEDKEENEQV